ncbi:MAG: LTA synthase family protein, partial [Bacteroidaceae bacterium]|nr:LTA synthase family protein [Bacteroidaceae bacterium]
MKQRIIKLILTFLLWVLVFALQKPVFMAYYHSLYAETSAADWLQVIWHGLPLDFSLAGYLTALPALLLIISVWTVGAWLRKTARTYFIIMALVVSVIFVVDLGLYQFWGFRLDATPVFYFLSSPADALASVGWGFKLVAIITMLFLAFFIFLLFRAWVLHPALQSVEAPKKWPTTGLLVLLTALLFIPIRGGFSEATMNTGHVYFSEEMILNHAAVNPAFNLMESLGKEGDFANQYSFMPADEAGALFEKLTDPQVKLNAQPDSLLQSILQMSEDSLHNLFTTKRPEVMFLILESFSSKLM